MESKKKIGEEILEILATAGVIGFTALCEGARDSGWVKGHNNPESRVKRSLNGLARRDLVVKIKSSGRGDFFGNLHHLILVDNIVVAA